MLPEVYSKELRRIIEKIRMPSAQCQACLSDKSHDKDIIFTCQICQSSIHNKHYGREIEENNQFSEDKWYCQRCRLVCLYAQNLRYKDIQDIQCHFCPSSKGILKRVYFNSNDTTKTVWIHPECSTWTFPLIFQKNNRRTHYNSEYPTRPTGKYWINLQKQASSQCQICKKEYGYKIKCMYYTCNKFYHCSCAKTIGIIRDLESMQYYFQNDTYIPPYCEDHMQKRVADCAVKIEKYKQMKDDSKTSHFKQLMSSYQVQLKNMQNSAKKYQEEEQLRLQMQYQAGQTDDIMEDISFSGNESYHSQHPQEFYDFIFDQDYPKINRPVNPFKGNLALIKSQANQEMQIEGPQMSIKEENRQMMGQLLRRVTEERPVKNVDRESELQEQSQWHSSQQIEQQSS